MRSHASWGSLSDVMIIFLNRKSYEIFRMDKEEYELYDEARKRAEGDKKRSETDNKDNKDKSADGEKKDGDTAAKQPEPIVIELEGIEDRTVRLTPASSSLSGFTPA